MAYLCRGPDCVAWQPEDKIQIKLKDWKPGNNTHYNNFDKQIDNVKVLPGYSLMLFQKEEDIAGEQFLTVHGEYNKTTEYVLPVGQGRYTASSARIWKNCSTKTSLWDNYCKDSQDPYYLSIRDYICDSDVNFEDSNCKDYCNKNKSKCKYSIDQYCRNYSYVELGHLLKAGNGSVSVCQNFYDEWTATIAAKNAAEKAIILAKKQESEAMIKLCSNENSISADLKCRNYCSDPINRITCKMPLIKHCNQWVPNPDDLSLLEEKVINGETICSEWLEDLKKLKKEREEEAAKAKAEAEREAEVERKIKAGILDAKQLDCPVGYTPYKQKGMLLVTLNLIFLYKFI